AFALQFERVGLSCAGIDGAELVDRACCVEEALGESCLTCVYVSKDAEIERAHGASCPAKGCSPFDWTRVPSFRSFLALSVARLPRQVRTPRQGAGQNLPCSRPIFVVRGKLIGVVTVLPRPVAVTVPLPSVSVSHSPWPVSVYETVPLRL